VARFDWYQATVSAEPRELLNALGGLSDVVRWEDLQRAPQGYGFGRRLVDDDGQVCQVWWGGTHELPHAIFTGEGSPAGADLLRGQFPGHRVTRADVCIDYAEPEAYDRLQGIALAIARDRGIKVGTAGDHLLTLKGRTLYLGAPSSHTRMRLYDKAQQLRDQFASNLVKLAEVPAHLARLEVQVRPQTAVAKQTAGTLDPVSLMGSAAWTRALMLEVGGVELEPFHAGKLWRQADDDRAYHALLAQYGGMLARKMVVHGDWACLGLQIGSDLAERSAQRARR
jgi:hypothetical protein